MTSEGAAGFMADADDNLVLRLLREMRAEMGEIRQDTAELRAGQTALRRQFDELRESALMAFGMAAHANQVVENRGERFDDLQDQIEALRRRVADLEAQRP
jgi:phage shock protein A